jgi:hypothetical protein
MKKFKERNKKLKVKTSNTFLSVKMMFFGPKNGGKLLTL